MNDHVQVVYADGPRRSARIPDGMPDALLHNFISQMARVTKTPIAAMETFEAVEGGVESST